MRSTLTRGALGAVVGGAALGVVNRLTHQDSKPKQLVSRIPVDLPRLDASKLAKNLDTKKLAKSLDTKKLAHQIGNLAEVLETRSEDVRNLSAQAKRLSRRFG